MKDKDPFLKKLRKELKDFPEEKQKEILEEINSHLEENQENAERAEKNNSDIKNGTPEDMAYNFKEVYRPRRFLDLLLVILPVFILIPLLQALLPYFKPLSGELQFSNVLINTRIIFLLSALLLIFAHRKKALFLSAFWLVRTLMICLTLIFREDRGNLFSVSSPAALIENIFWLVIFLLLLFLLGKTLWANKGNFLLMAFLLLPLAVLPANLNLYGQPALSNGTGSYQWMIFFERALALSAYCLIFLGTKRVLRWAGLVLLAAGSTYSLLMAYGFHALVYLPAVFVIFLWLLDFLKDPLRDLMKKIG